MPPPQLPTTLLVFVGFRLCVVLWHFTDTASAPNLSKFAGLFPAVSVI